MHRLNLLRLAALVAVLPGAGCGGGDGGGVPPMREAWVAADLLVPLDSVQAAEYGFDLDADGAVDNQLGNVMSALAQAAGPGAFDFQGTTSDAVRAGATIQLVETWTGSATSIALRTGAPAIAPCTDPIDPVTCGRHLNGTTSFAATAAVQPALSGSGTPASFRAGPGPAALQVPLFGGATVTLPLVRARAALTRSGPTLAGKIGGAVTQSDVDAVVIPALHAWIGAAVTRDCTAGTCLGGSIGETMLALFDDDGDGAVTLAEVTANPLIGTLLRPDVDTNGDLVPDALSVGFGYYLVGAVF